MKDDGGLHGEEESTIRDSLPQGNNADLTRSSQARDPLGISSVLAGMCSSSSYEIIMCKYARVILPL